jgi:hypothetical protein
MCLSIVFGAISCFATFDDERPKSKWDLSPAEQMKVTEIWRKQDSTSEASHISFIGKGPSEEKLKEMHQESRDKDGQEVFFDNRQCKSKF